MDVYPTNFPYKHSSASKKTSASICVNPRLKTLASKKTSVPHLCLSVFICVWKTYSLKNNPRSSASYTTLRSVCMRRNYWTRRLRGWRIRHFVPFAWVEVIGNAALAAGAYDTPCRLHEKKLLDTPLTRLAHTSLRSVCMRGSYWTRRSRGLRIRHFVPFAWEEVIGHAAHAACAYDTPCRLHEKKLLDTPLTRLAHPRLKTLASKKTSVPYLCLSVFICVKKTYFLKK